jgi:hypothetical protein
MRMPTVFPILFTALHTTLHNASGAQALFPWQTETFAKVHDIERLTSPAINAPDGLHSDGEFVRPAQTLSDCGRRNKNSVHCAEIQIEIKL